MKKVFVISVIALLLVSCSTKNVAIEKLEPNARINREHEALDYNGNDTVEHAYIAQDYKEIDENESNVAEDYPLHQEDTEKNVPLINPVKKNTEMDQVITQPFSPPNKQEKVIDEQIVDGSHPPVITHPPIVTTPPQVEEPKELAPDPLCPNSLYDENQTCDWIHPNLKPTDELGRTVPIFFKSEDAWNWAEKQLFDKTSIWYMCGFNLMDGHTNDGTNFFYGYMKACP